MSSGRVWEMISPKIYPAIGTDTPMRIPREKIFSKLTASASEFSISSTPLSADISRPATTAVRGTASRRPIIADFMFLPARLPLSELFTAENSLPRLLRGLSTELLNISKGANRPNRGFSAVAEYTRDAPPSIRKITSSPLIRLFAVMENTAENAYITPAHTLWDALRVCPVLPKYTSIAVNSSV